MLELQRASSGSGKTFTLARKFIWYFITVNDNGRRRLRTRAELEDSLEHILAVTFTNKATNEMQQRIVEKLYLLGFPPAGGKKPDYLEDFASELSRSGVAVSEEEVSRTCRDAVRILLNNYSDFNVSTIDSFFQLVLRTFAYESDLSDSYRIELDGKMLSAMAIDSLLEDINSGTDHSGASWWISELVRRATEKGQKWNVFEKKEEGSNPYAKLLDSATKLENEEFKTIRDRLDRYFDSTENLVEIYNDLR